MAYATVSAPLRFKPTYKLLALSMSASLALSACGTGSNDDSGSGSPRKTGVQSLATGQLLTAAQNTKTLSASELNTALEQIDPAAAQIAGAAVCGVKVEYMHYDTVDAKGATTDATGAVFIPTGTDPKCTGSRPVILHAHGTATMQNYNFAEVGNASNEAGARATLIAANYAGQGYVVIAPNYAGYDKSGLTYHPYLNANQQAHEMADALKAGRTVISQNASTTQVSDNGKLFLTGYSQGGHVAMAAARYLEQLQEPVTAAMPMSGPYAMGAFGDVVFGGNVMLGAPFFAPLMARSYQEAYGNIYSSPSDIYASSNAANVATLLPSKSKTPTQLVATGDLPQSAMFQAAPTGITALDSMSPADPNFSYGFDKTNYLIKNDYRATYLADAQTNPDWGVAYLKGMTQYSPVIAANPTNTLRQALRLNDLRSYTPSMPVVMCGGNQDPMVFFDVNAGLVNQLWQAQSASNANLKYAMIDMDISNQATRNKAVFVSHGLPTTISNTLQTQSSTLQSTFAKNLQLVAQNAATVALQGGATPAQAQAAATRAVVTGYHTMVEPYCENTARAMFNQL